MPNKTDENKVPARFNPANFAYQVSGQAYSQPLTEFSKEDLMQIACECMAVLERINKLTIEQASLFSRWQNNNLTNEDID